MKQDMPRARKRPRAGGRVKTVGGRAPSLFTAQVLLTDCQTPVCIYAIHGVKGIEKRVGEKKEEGRPRDGGRGQRQVRLGTGCSPHSA